MLNVKRMTGGAASDSERVGKNRVKAKHEISCVVLVGGRAE